MGASMGSDKHQRDPIMCEGEQLFVTFEGEELFRKVFTGLVVHR